MTDTTATETQGATEAASAQATTTGAHAAAETQTRMRDFAADAQKSMQDGVAQVTRHIETAHGFGQENLDAMVESSRVAARAAESINAQLVAFTKKSMEDSLAMAKELGTCRSVTDYVEKSNAYNRQAIDHVVSEAGRLNELYAAAAREVFEPINARLQATVDMMRSYRA